MHVYLYMCNYNRYNAKPIKSIDHCRLLWQKLAERRHQGGEEPVDEETQPDPDGPAHVEARQLLPAPVTFSDLHPSMTSVTVSRSLPLVGLSVPVTHAIIECNT